LEQSNYLANQKQRAVDTVFIIRIHGSESCACFQDPRSLPVDSLDFSDEPPHARFEVQGHILSIGGDALMALYAKRRSGAGFF
jgi:hypothetical protein